MSAFIPPDELSLKLPRVDEDRAMRIGDFEQLYDKHAPFVWRMVRSLGVNGADAEDVAQEVFLTAFHKLGEFEGRSSLQTWLCGIAVGVARNHLRKASRRRRLAPPAAPPTTPADATEAIDLVSRCLAELDEPLRLVFALAELEQLTGPEIAETLMLNLNTVYSRLRQARDQFEAVLARHGGHTR